MHRYDQMTQKLAKKEKGKKKGIKPTHFFDRVKDADMLLSPITVNLHTNNNLRPIASV